MVRADSLGAYSIVESRTLAAHEPARHTHPPPQSMVPARHSIEQTIPSQRGALAADTHAAAWQQRAGRQSASVSQESFPGRGFGSGRRGAAGESRRSAPVTAGLPSASIADGRAISVGIAYDASAHMSPMANTPTANR